MYIGSLYEVTGSTTRKHVFLGPRHIQIKESTGSVYYIHSDHLGSSNVVTDGNATQVQKLEYDPFGTIWSSTGSDITKHKYTGKELDDTTGLYFYGARYYDPSLGRFITADPTIQRPFDPQDLNRYTYCRNNPINYTDPTGLGWFSKLWDWFKDEVLQPLISFVTTFIFSGGNLIAATAAAIATASLDTGEGRQFMERFGEEFFDDVLGMKPKTAYIWSSIVSHIAATWTLERVLANTVADRISSQRPYDAKNKADLELKENPEGYDPFGRYPGQEGDPIKLELFKDNQLTTLVGKGEAVLSIVDEDVKSGGLSKLKLGLHPKHIGAIAEDFPKSGITKIAPRWWYGTLYGTCQQATNATWLMSGISNTVTDIYPHWSTYLSTTLYGNYGGGLPRSVYTGIQASQDYRD